MAWFGQGRDTIEWNEFRDDVLFYRWPNTEIKKGARLVIRPGQRAIFFAGGQLEGVFEQPGTYDVETDITPFLSSLKGWFQLRGDTGLRAEVYFVNAKELLLKWGTRQRIMIPTQEVPSGIPVGCNGNLIVEFFQVADPQSVIFDLLNQSLHLLLQFFQNLLFRQARLSGTCLDCGFESVAHFCSLSCGCLLSVRRPSRPVYSVYNAMVFVDSQ